MRYGLDHKDRSACPLADEIAAARAYLRIRELRFDKALTCSVDVDADAEDVLVPHLILQGLLENAVKHGLRPTTGAPLRIEVTARRVGGALHMLVSHPATYPPRREPARGLGPVNIRRRLELQDGVLGPVSALTIRMAGIGAGLDYRLGTQIQASFVAGYALSSAAQRRPATGRCRDGCSSPIEGRGWDQREGGSTFTPLGPISICMVLRSRS